MLDPKQFDEMAKRFSENLPSGLRDFQAEVEKNARVALQSTFNRMELVTREEFDAQAKVLARTRERLEALEARIAALEGGTAADDAPAPDSASDSPTP
jgi:BMFP domain-containing protein YqiC